MPGILRPSTGVAVAGGKWSSWATIRYNQRETFVSCKYPRIFRFNFPPSIHKRKIFLGERGRVAKQVRI